MDENTIEQFESIEPFTEPESPEFYLIIPEFNSQGRLCNYHTGEGAEVKVMYDEWERFNQLAGRQHEIIDGVVVYDENFEPCMPDDMLQSELREVESQLLEILDQERLDIACGTMKPAPMSTGLTEKDLLIQRRKELMKVRIN